MANLSQSIQKPYSLPIIEGIQRNTPFNPNGRKRHHGLNAKCWGQGITF
jgi:hypothetical protein